MFWRLSVYREYSRLDYVISDLFFGKQGKQFTVKEMANIMNEMLKEAYGKPWSPGDLNEDNFLVACCTFKPGEKPKEEKDQPVIDKLLAFYKLYIDSMKRDTMDRSAKDLLANRWWDLLEKFLRRQQSAVRGLAYSLDVEVDLQAVDPPLRFVHGRGVPKPRPKKQVAARASASRPKPEEEGGEDDEEEEKKAAALEVGDEEGASGLRLAPSWKSSTSPSPSQRL